MLEAAGLSVTWRVVALIAITALAFLVWRGYQQPELILDFANLRFC